MPSQPRGVAARPKRKESHFGCIEVYALTYRRLRTDERLHLNMAGVLRMARKGPHPITIEAWYADGWTVVFT